MQQGSGVCGLLCGIVRSCQQPLQAVSPTSTSILLFTLTAELREQLFLPDARLLRNTVFEYLLRRGGCHGVSRLGGDQLLVAGVCHEWFKRGGSSHAFHISPLRCPQRSASVCPSH